MAVMAVAAELAKRKPFHSVNGLPVSPVKQFWRNCFTTYTYVPYSLLFYLSIYNRIYYGDYTGGGHGRSYGQAVLRRRREVLPEFDATAGGPSTWNCYCEVCRVVSLVPLTQRRADRALSTTAEHHSYSASQASGLTAPSRSAIRRARSPSSKTLRHDCHTTPGGRRGSSSGITISKRSSTKRCTAKLLGNSTGCTFTHSLLRQIFRPRSSPRRNSDRAPIVVVGGRLLP